MKNSNRLLASLAALMLGAVPVMSGLAEAPAETEAAMEMPTLSLSDPMVTINGNVITRAEVLSLADYLYNYYTQSGYDLSDEESQSMLIAMAIDSAVSMAVESAKAAELGFDYDHMTDAEKLAIEDEVNETWESLIDQYINYYGGGLAEDATEEEKLTARTAAMAGLESMGYTYDAIMQDMAESASYEKLYAYVTADAAVTDEDVVAAFNAKVDADREMYGSNIFMYEFYTQYYGMESYYIPEGYRGVTHILLQVDDELLNTYSELAAKLEEQEQAADAEATTDEAAEATEVTAPVTQEDVDAAREAVLASVQDTIDTIYAELDKGTPFEALIAEYGTDPGMTVEPNKSEGYSVHADSMMYDTVFTQAAFSVDNVGDVAQPVVGMYGVHIVKYLRDVPSGAVELTDVIRANLTEELRSTAETNLFNSTMSAWASEMVISFSDEATAYLSLLQ